MVLVVLSLGSLGVGYLIGSYNRQNVVWSAVPGSFYYNPLGQVRVDSVWANVTTASGGREDVTFFVTFENTGRSPIYAVGGWVGALSASLQENPAVLQETPSKMCLAATYIVTLKQGQNATIYAPDCGSGFNFQLVHPGSVSVSLGFNWTTNGQESTPFSNSTTIQANFRFN